MPWLLPFLIALVPSGFMALSIWRTVDLPPVGRFAVAFVAGLGITTAAVAVAALWLDQAGDPWNAARLAPAIALHYGYPLYYPLETGPVLSTVVGPVAFLAYWPIGFIRSSPTALILAASAGNLLVFALIVRTLLRHVSADPVEKCLAALVATQLALFYPALRYSLFGIHADAPALALAAGGLLLVLGGREALTWRRAAGAALCLSLATWAKQSLAPAFPAIAVLVALRDGRRAAFRFLTASAGIGSMVSLIFVAWLGFGDLRLNMFSVPAHHPWLQMSLSTGEIYPHVTAEGAAAHVKVLFAAMLQIVRTSWPLFTLFAALLGERFLRRVAGESWWPRASWSAFALLAVALLPTAATGRVKLGGEVNHESFSVFFLGLALVAWSVDSTSGDRRSRLIRLACIAGVLLALVSPRVLEYSGGSIARENQNESAFRYDRDHPGRVYFPWNPLTSLLIEGKVYHFDYGVFDRNLGGAQVTAAHLALALPSPRPVIASYIAHHDYILKTYFPDYVSLPPEPGLTGWKLFGPPPVPNAP